MVMNHVDDIYKDMLSLLHFLFSQQQQKKGYSRDGYVKVFIAKKKSYGCGFG
jgi:hypothetical protein